MLKNVTALFRRKRPKKIRLEDLPEPEAFIVSYPKCGRTWLRLMLGHYLCKQHNIDPRLALETLYVTHRAGFLPTNFTHDGVKITDSGWYPVALDSNRYLHKRVLLLIRDPRDVVVSSYFQVTKRDKNYQGTLHDFIRAPHHGARSYLEFLQIWEEHMHVPDIFTLMRYKEIHRDPALHLRALLTFIGCKTIDEQTVQEVVQYANFPNMRQLEATRFFPSKRLAPGDVNDPESYKVRYGKAGGYKNYLSPEDCAYVEHLIDQSRCKLLDTYRNRTPAKAALAMAE